MSIEEAEASKRPNSRAVMRELMGTSGMRVQDVAERMGITQPSLSDMLNPKNEFRDAPSLDTIERFAEAISLTLYDILREAERIPPPPTTVEGAIDADSELVPVAKEMVKAGYLGALKFSEEQRAKRQLSMQSGANGNKRNT